jgi:hypothetical protein
MEELLPLPSRAKVVCKMIVAAADVIRSPKLGQEEEQFVKFTI